MSSIYDQHSAAFSQVSAWVVLDRTGELVARVATKHPRDGGGKLWAYVHWLGIPMVRGAAYGGGYDKVTAAVSAAAKHMPEALPAVGRGSADEAAYQAFREAARKDDGNRWGAQVEAAGFTVLQAV